MNNMSFARYLIPIALGLLLVQPLWAQTKPASAKPATAAGSKSTDDKKEEDDKPAPKRPVRDLALYQAQVEYRAGSETREVAIGRALQAVVVKLTGSREARMSTIVRQSMASATNLASDVSVVQENDVENGIPVYRQMLTAKFDPTAVDTIIGAAGLRYWTGDRPKPILWLVIDDGRGPRLVTSQQLSVVKPLATAGLERGMRFLLPAGTAPEQAAVNSIMSLNTVALLPLTARYQNSSFLVGKVYRKQGAWSADWVLVRDGATVANWTATDPDHRRAIASGAEGSANALAKADGRYLPYGSAGKHLFVIDGVDSQADFLRMMGYLQGLPVVRRIEVLSAEPSSVRLMLDMSVGPRGFQLLTQGSNVFAQVGNSDDDSAEDSRATRLRLN
jgi:uncharacterized protein